MANKSKLPPVRSILFVQILFIVVAVLAIGYAIIQANNTDDTGSSSQTPAAQQPGDSLDTTDPNNPGTSEPAQTETQKCLDDWYKKHPETRPENRVPGNVYLEPPCPGVPQ